ncbi:hypothetical protein [Nostoc sp.]|uniref:hypothetical protein n=1 Tax=Nostoc sp. TaxID=1180 RepID=UPI002FF9F527
MPEKQIYRASNETEALRQGEILSGVIQFKPVQFKPVPNETSSSFENLDFIRKMHPYAIVVSQDCDLDWDYKAKQNKSQPNKLLNSIILCEVYAAEDIRSNKANSDMNSQQWNLVKTNRHEQYHFFEKVTPEYELIKQGLPELTVDFKQVFGIDSQFLYDQLKTKQTQRRTVLESPYLEHFSYRYHCFHGRIALPSPHVNEK